MTRRSVYGAALVAFVAACAMTISSVAIPRWISWDKATDSGHPVRYNYGLHSLCNTITHSCTKFPEESECHGEDRYFCNMWRSIGFLMSFAVVIEGMTLIAFVVMLAGGKQKRESGWRIISGFLVLVGLVQCTAMALVVFLYDNDDRFFKGWILDTSWILCTVSWSIQVLLALGLTASAFLLSPEGGYELIPDMN